MNSVIAKALFKSYSYLEYRKLISDLLIEGKSTGDTQSEELTHYSNLNDVRMKRLDKTMTISQENSLKLQSLKGEYIWIVISEGWCGDAAQILSIVNLLAEVTKAIDLKIVLRDENLELMKLFLTNGAMAIPKLIVINKITSSYLANWGPRPKGASDLIKNAKEKYGSITEEVKTELQLWYLQDKGMSTQNEIIAMMSSLE